MVGDGFTMHIAWGGLAFVSAYNKDWRLFFYSYFRTYGGSGYYYASSRWRTGTQVIISKIKML